MTTNCIVEPSKKFGGPKAFLCETMVCYLPQVDVPWHLSPWRGGSSPTLPGLTWPTEGCGLDAWKQWRRRDLRKNAGRLQPSVHRPTLGVVVYGILTAWRKKQVNTCNSQMDSLERILPSFVLLPKTIVFSTLHWILRLMIRYVLKSKTIFLGEAGLHCSSVTYKVLWPVHTESPVSMPPTLQILRLSLRI